MSVLDRQLQNDKYIYGNQLSLADVTFAAHFRAAYLGGFQLAGRGFDRVESLWKLLQKTSGIQDIIADENKYLAG